MSAQSPLVYRSAVGSLLVQVLVTGITAGGFAAPKASPGLLSILTLELVSQIVEFVWYLTVVCRYRTILTWTRYLDWVVSTPLMLLSAALFFRLRNGDDGADALGRTLQETATWLCFVLNWVMLGFGLLVETRRVPKGPGLALGGVAFVASYTMLALFVQGSDPLSVGLFSAMFVVWALYGVAAAANDDTKNVAYNALDIVSKNFYGVFLFGYAMSL